MKQVKLIKSGSVASFEENLNRFLDEISDKSFEIQFSSSYNGNTDIYAALVIYEL
ncbi:hypothetical protein [Bacillus sp. UMB0893]|uniref:hypothetical protein n=1 Tax=Bacillus sp. UMB0893 TaxID=2066053 RepID=UPI0015DE1B73|nr:hypothetical protein [Bacillus sp. UMB0893]